VAWGIEEVTDIGKGVGAGARYRDREVLWAGGGSRDREGCRGSGGYREREALWAGGGYRDREGCRGWGR